MKSSPSSQLQKFTYNAGHYTAKQLIKAAVVNLGRWCGCNIVRYPPPDFTRKDMEMIQSVEPYTLTGPECRFVLLESVKYVVRNSVPGDIVECGVWRGGSMMVVAKTLVELEHSSKHLYLFDTFSGMTNPSPVDISYLGEPASERFRKVKLTSDSSRWCYASVAEVKETVYSTGYDKSKVHFIEGKVEDSIPDQAPEVISLLRLDTDWYESTRHELVHLFPRLARGGVLIIDDYGHWLGAKKAVDEYIAENDIPILLNRIDRSARIGVKL